MAGVRIGRRGALVTLGALGMTVAAAAGGYALVENEVVPGSSAVDRALGRCDAPLPAAALLAPPPFSRR